MHEEPPFVGFDLVYPGKARCAVGFHQNVRPEFSAQRHPGRVGRRQHYHLGRNAEHHRRVRYRYGVVAR